MTEKSERPRIPPPLPPSETPPSKEEEKPKPIEVTIIGRETVTVSPRLGEFVRMVRIDYQALDLPPATIWIPETEYSEEEENKRIREDIERRLKVKPEVKRI